MATLIEVGTKPVTSIKTEKRTTLQVCLLLQSLVF
uniref:Uncharacterized protein n=1 Tax=Arundo donax TaxID=35708 RepID=A0A0A9GIC5_ARUDO